MPSEKTLNFKKKYVADLVEKIKASAMGVVVSYKGINVENATKLRKEMREANLEYFVVKNTMLNFATKEVGYDMEQHLHGTTAIALSKEDPIMVSKILTKYVKDLKDETEFKIKTGFLDGKVIEAGLINELGSLPTKEELVGRVLGLLTSPIRRFAIAIKAVAEKNSSEKEESTKKEETSKEESTVEK